MGDERFWEDFSDYDEIAKIVTDLATLTEEDVARELPAIIERARKWRSRHVSSVG